MTGSNSAILLGCCMLVVTSLVLVLWHGGKPRIGSSTTVLGPSPQSMPSAAAEFVCAPAGSEQTSRVLDSRVQEPWVTVTVIAGDTGRTIQGARIDCIPGGRLLRSSDRRSVGVTDDQGQCAVRMETPVQKLLVSAVGYCAHNLQPDTKVDAALVTLWPERRVTVEVAGLDRRPIEGVLAVVGSGVCPFSTEDLVTFEPSRAEAFRDLLSTDSKAPLWFGVTDAQGRAVIHGVPQGTYAVECFRVGMWEQRMPGRESGNIEVDAVDVICRVMLTDLFVAGVRAVSGDAACAYAETSIGSLGVSARATAIRDTLMRRWPDLAWLGIGTMLPSSDPLATVHVFSQNQGWIVETSSYQRWTEFEPALMRTSSPTSTPVAGTLRAELRDRAGRVVPGADWVAVEAAGRWVLTGRSGEDILCPPGRYQLRAPMLERSGATARDIEVVAGEAKTASLVVDQVIRAVALSIRTFDGAPVPNCTVRVDTVEGQRLFSCVTTRQHIDLLLPMAGSGGGEVDIVCSCAGLIGRRRISFSDLDVTMSADVTMAP